MKFFFQRSKIFIWHQNNNFWKKKFQNFSKNFLKKIHDFFSNVKCVNMCDMIQIKTTKNQMSTSQQYTNTIFIVKKPLKDGLLSLQFLTKRLGRPCTVYSVHIRAQSPSYKFLYTVTPATVLSYIWVVIYKDL